VPMIYGNCCGLDQLPEGLPPNATVLLGFNEPNHMCAAAFFLTDISPSAKHMGYIDLASNLSCFTFAKLHAKHAHFCMHCMHTSVALESMVVMQCTCSRVNKVET
jgi:hypothetical protein